MQIDDRPPGGADPVEDLIRRAATGEAHAVADMTRQIEPALRRAAHRELGHGGRNRIDTDDVVQEALLSIMPALATLKYRGPQAFRAWVTRVGERAARAARRYHHAQRRDLRAQQSLATAADPVHRGTTPTSAARRSESVRTVQAALQLVSPRHREVIELRSMAGEDFDEIARRMGLATASSARSLFARAMDSLAEQIAPSSAREGVA